MKADTQKILSRRGWLCVGMSACVSIIVAGCEISDSPAPTRRDPQPIRDSGSGIPKNTSIAASGRGPISYRAKRDGTVYIWDDDRSTLVVSNRIRKGETVSVLPDQNRIVIDDKKISDEDLKKTNVHRIYVEPPEPRDGDYVFGARPPSSADVVAEGWGDLYWTTPSRGVVYIYDEQQGVVLRREIEARAEVAILAGRGIVTFDGRRVLDSLPRDSRHRIYFESTRSTDDVRNPDAANAIPRDAEMVAEGKGVDLSLKPKRDGTFWVYDADAKRVLYKGRIRANQRFTLAPAKDVGALEGKKVFDQPLSPRVKYRIYYVKG